MSESQRGMRGPPPASQPPMGQRDQFQYIPEQERSYGYCQPNVPPQRYPGSFPQTLPPPPPPPPMVDHNLPPPMFSRPPPPPPPCPSIVPPRFSQPPPAMPRTPNIPAAFRAPTMAPRDGSSTWQRNPPPVPQCPQLQGDAGPGSVTHPVNVEETPGIMEQREEVDARWLGEFEKRVQSSAPPPSSHTESSTARKNIKLAEVQRLVLESYSLKEQLCGLEKELVQVSDSADDKEWDQLVQQAEVVKRSLHQIVTKFQDQGFVEHTKTLLKQRRAKRSRVKRRKKETQLEKEQLKRKREEEEAEIDAWRAKLQREEESKRQEDAVKREADSVLSEVRQKQNEGQRMVQLLEALAGLRRTRAVQAIAQGQPKNEKAEQRFTTTTDMISKIVKEQLKEYELEEQTLRVMMEESASHRSAAISAKGDANFARYEDSIKKLLFGPTALTDTQGDDAGMSMETLVQRRREWDQYVVEGDSPLASAVPLSWVVPPAQPDPSWAAFLKK